MRISLEDVELMTTWTLWLGSSDPDERYAARDALRDAVDDGVIPPTLHDLLLAIAAAEDVLQNHYT